jgi:hypothetical protein
MIRRPFAAARRAPGSSAVFAALWLGVLAWVGCAPLPPMSTRTPVPPSAGKPPGTTPVPRSAPAPVSIVPADSTPSREALEVLDSIPEPLTPGQRIPPPSRSEAEAAADTAAETPGADVPVPEPTLPLGERRRAATDSAAASGGAAPRAPQGPSGPTNPTPPAAPPSTAPSSAAPPSAAPSDTCWRVQVLAPINADEAIQARDAASSLLLVPMVVEREQGRYKVRTKNCLTRTAADLLKQRAVQSGFAKAFRIMGARL